MGNRVVFPSKHVSSDFRAVVDMSPLLYTGEAIVTAEVMITLLLGDDPGCNLILSGTASVYHNVVTQWLRDGLIGNTYSVRITGSTSLGNSVITMADLSVISSDPM